MDDIKAVYIDGKKFEDSLLGKYARSKTSSLYDYVGGDGEWVENQHIDWVEGGRINGVFIDKNKKTYIALGTFVATTWFKLSDFEIMVG